jgi:pyruvate,water dikinase
MDETFFGVMPGIPPYEEQPGDVRPDLSEKIGATFGWVFAQGSLSDLTELTDHRNETIALRANRPDFSTMSDRELWDLYMSLVPQHRKYFAQHLFTTYMATVPVGAIAAVATAVGRPDLIMPIVAGIGEVDSAEPSHAMWAMSRLAPDSAEFAVALESFLLNYGSRGPNEWDIRSDVWETDPNLVRVLVDRMRSMGAESPDIRNEHNAVLREEATARTRVALAGTPDTLAQFDAALRSAHTFLAGRERTKTNVIKVLHEIRMALRELAQRHEYTMSELCMLLDDELDAFLAGRKLPWPILFSGKGWEDPLARSYGISGIPQLILVGRDGNVISTTARGERLGELLAGLFPADDGAAAPAATQPDAAP